MAAISRPISIFDGAFSSRDMVGCEHRGSPLSGAWPTAILIIARRDREHPQPKHLLKRVLNAFRLAPVADARSKARRQPELLLDTAQHKHAGVRRQLAAIEPNAQLLARNRWKFKRQ